MHASVCLIAYVPEFKELWCIKLVEAAEWNIDEEGFSFWGYWDVYINCKLELEQVPGIFEYDKGEGWYLYLAVEVVFEGSAICYRHQATIPD